MRYYVMDRKSASYFEKADGSRIWNVNESSESLSRRLGDMALVVSLDERNFNESLNTYLNGKFYGQLMYDERLGWIS